MRDESRALAQARIAASAPKTTYGKHRNKLLPLTGSQFLRNDVLGNTERRATARDTTRSLDRDSPSDDSPLSDAEPFHETRDSLSAVARMRWVLPLIKPFPAGRHSGRAVGTFNEPVSHAEIERYGARSRSPLHDQSTRNHERLRHPKTSAQKKGKLKPASVTRSRLALNELVLIPGARDEDSFNETSRTRKKLPQDPISSSRQPLFDTVSSSDSEVTPLKRKAKVPLSAIRKRIRTPSSGHKSLASLRRKNNALQTTPARRQAGPLIGDGFEQSELTLRHSRIIDRHPRKQREPFLAGLQALSLASGPLPDVEFSQYNVSQLEVVKNTTPEHDHAVTNIDVPVPMATSLDESNTPPKRRVSPSYDAERIISAQLSSISAPAREPSIPLDCEDEHDGDDSGDEDADDDEAADAYLDGDKQPLEEDHCDLNDVDHGSQSTSSKDFEVQDASQRDLLQRPHHRARSIEPISSAVFANINRPRVPSLRGRTFSGKPRLNELDEPIDDDFRIDDMLLDDEERQYMAIDQSRAGRLTSGRRDRSLADHKDDVAQSTSTRPRSILKNSTPYVSSDSNRRESTAANTRRNLMSASTVDYEESRYFSAATDQLDSTPIKQTIVRKKSSSRFSDQIMVPDSDEVAVLETSPSKLDYTNAGQMHLLRRTNEATWTSSAAIVPQTDLRSLTRSVSKHNGTLSQSVRRRSSLSFQVPTMSR